MVKLMVLTHQKRTTWMNQNPHNKLHNSVIWDQKGCPKSFIKECFIFNQQWQNRCQREMFEWWQTLFQRLFQVLPRGENPFILSVVIISPWAWVPQCHPGSMPLPAWGITFVRNGDWLSGLEHWLIQSMMYFHQRNTENSCVVRIPNAYFSYSISFWIQKRKSI
jgi:hypothetical protein